MEQLWASQLLVFDFDVKYRSGTTNRNADALSRLPNLQVPESIETIAPGITVPFQLDRQQLQGDPSHHPCTSTTLAVGAIPVCQKADLRTLQALDAVIGAFWLYWKRGRAPTREEREFEGEGALGLVRQWSRIREKEGVLYREVQLPPRHETVHQGLLPSSLKTEVLTSLHDNHGHQGAERTTCLVRERCY